MALSKSKIISLLHHNELCERFSHCGMRSLIYLFLRTQYNFTPQATLIAVHSLWAFQYTVPLVAGLLFLFKYGEFFTIAFFGILHLIGSLLLFYSSVVAHQTTCLWISLILISFSLGAVRAPVITSDDEVVPVSLSFRSFYNFITFSIFLSSIWSPLLSDITCLGKNSCYALSFGLSALLTGCALLLFLSGTHSLSFRRNQKELYTQLLSLVSRRMLRYFLKSAPLSETDLSLLSDISVLSGVILTISPISIFWMLYDQQYSSWIEQALSMDISFLPLLKSYSGNITAVNTLVMIVMIPAAIILLYPSFKLICKQASNHKKLVVSVAVASFSFFVAAGIEYKITVTDEKISFLWQAPQYLLIALSEMLLCMGEMSFLYEKCPNRLRSVALVFWLLIVGLSNGILAIFIYINPIRFLLRLNNCIADYMFFGFLGLYSTVTLARIQSDN